MTTVVISSESARGCGYRKPSKNGVGIYLVGPKLSAPCGKLPIELTKCPCCSGGIKPTRGWTWIQPRALFTNRLCTADAENFNGTGRNINCLGCPLGGALPEGQHGLLWIGGSFYETPLSFTSEAATMGVSRKLGALPKGFELGTTVVYLAHRKAIIKDEIDPERPADTRKVGYPGVFSAFKPTGVDLVVDDENAVPERAERLVEQVGAGARIVKVVRADEQRQASLFDRMVPS